MPCFSCRNCGKCKRSGLYRRRCVKCGELLGKDARSCPKCGAPQPPPPGSRER